MHAGIQLPVPFTNEALDLVASRMTTLSHRYPEPFLIENTTYYLPGMPHDSMDEIAFLNGLVERTSCGLLFDVYNFYCNAVNFGFDPSSQSQQTNCG